MTMTVTRVLLADKPGPQVVQVQPDAFPISAAFWKDPHDAGMTVSALMMFCVAEAEDPTTPWQVTVARTGEVVPDDASIVGSCLGPDGLYRHVFATPPEVEMPNGDAGDAA
jgi:hypothetical protein